MHDPADRDAAADGETAAIAPSAAAVPPADATAALADQDAAAAPSSAPATEEPSGDLSRWVKLAVIAALLLVAALVVSVVTDDGPPEGTFEVEIDRDDPGGTARDLGERLRERADQ